MFKLVCTLISFAIYLSHRFNNYANCAISFCKETNEQRIQTKTSSTWTVYSVNMSASTWNRSRSTRGFMGITAHVTSPFWVCTVLLEVPTFSNTLVGFMDSIQGHLVSWILGSWGDGLSWVNFAVLSAHFSLASTI